MVFEINDVSFEKEVVKSEVPVVVDFWAPWCGPCKMLTPITERLAQKFEGKVKFCKINVDENPMMATQYRVMSIPTLIFIKGGQQVASSVGALPEAMLRPKIEALIEAA